MEFLRQNFALLLPLIVIQLGLMATALVDLWRRERVTWGNKLPWLFIIVLGGILGPIIYFAFGRKD